MVEEKFQGTNATEHIGRRYPAMHVGAREYDVLLIWFFSQPCESQLLGTDAGSSRICAIYFDVHSVLRDKN